MIIRKATSKDFEGYCKLKKEETIDYGKIVGEKIKMPARKPLKKEFNDFLSKHSILIVLEDNNKLAGYGCGRIYGGVWGTKFHIWYLFVEKDYRKKGLGTKIIKKMIEFAKSRRVKKIALDVNPTNHIAQKLYEKLGFKVDKYRMTKRVK